VEKMLIDAYTEADEYSKYTGLKNPREDPCKYDFRIQERAGMSKSTLEATWQPS
jgi:hypothetical protein